jgi:folate-dependent phosphoribosylglycinamide formyltransferase PurN
MKVILLCGDHPRHFAIARAIQETGMLSAIGFELREAAVPLVPQGLDSHLEELYRRHFLDRQQAELNHFGATGGISVPRLEFAPDQVNSEQVRSFVREAGADILISYGIHKLDDETLAQLPSNSWNLHGGLSPWYRGVITHFWPSYCLEPQFTGMTLHRLTNRLDAGDVVHQSVAPMIRGDGIHDVACRAVLSMASEIGQVLDLAVRSELTSPVPQRSSGKLWLAREWTPRHLTRIYDEWDNKIVDAYLDGKFMRNEPKLVRQRLRSFSFANS